MANPTKAQVEAILGDLNEDDQKVLKAFLEGKGGKTRRSDEATLLAKYPHMVEGSLRMNPTANKQEALLACQFRSSGVAGGFGPGCDKQEYRFTSDFFQIKFCEEHKKEAAKSAREAKAAHIKDLLAKAAERKV